MSPLVSVYRKVLHAAELIIMNRPTLEAGYKNRRTFESDTLQFQDGSLSLKSMLLSRILLVILLFPCLIFAQEQQEEIPHFTEDVSVSIVNLYASVRDDDGRPVHALKQEDFSLYVDGQKQTITNFSADITEPLNLAFLVDVSGSMGMLHKFETAQRIIHGMVGRLGKEDEVALLIFADGAVERLIDFTKDKQKMLDRLSKLKPYGGNALRNAVGYAADYSFKMWVKRGSFCCRTASIHEAI